jgi:hypothetical protein
MFSELPKLLDRNFVLSFFLPTVVFTSVNLYFVNIYVPINIVSFLLQDLLVGTSLIGLVVWLISVVLLVNNRDLYRLLEGYGALNPARLLKRWQLYSFHKLNNKIDELNAQYLMSLESSSPFPPEKRAERNAVLRKLSESFPDAERWILPTAFGNVIRAFEVYPRVMYGFESIDGWSRLLAVIPDHYRSLIDDAKSQVDFWVNILILFSVLVIEYIIFIFLYGADFNWVLLVSFFVVIYFASYRARHMAIDWGDMVKSAVDLYRFDLVEKLGISPPKDRKEERRIWENFSQSIVYRVPESLPELRKTVNKNSLKSI